MSTNSQINRAVRYFAALVSVLTAVIYFLIAFNMVSVLDTPADQIFGFPAGAAYLLGALLLVAVNRRPVWILGALLQVFVIYMYFNLASRRSPDFEFWGVILRIPQLMILVALVYLAGQSSPAQLRGDKNNAQIRNEYG